MILPQNLLVQNIKIKLNLITWMTMKSSVVIFQALEPLQPHCPHQPRQPHWPQQPLLPYIIKVLPEPDCWIIPGTKMTNNGPFCRMDHQKSSFLWMLLFWKLINETQMGKTPESIRHHNSRNLMILLPVRAIYDHFTMRHPVSKYRVVWHDELSGNPPETSGNLPRWVSGRFLNFLLGE